jgi:hypothetical protein
MVELETMEDAEFDPKRLGLETPGNVAAHPWER